MEAVIHTTSIAPCPNRGNGLVIKTNNKYKIMIKYDDNEINGVLGKCGRNETKSISEHQAMPNGIPNN